MAVLYAIPTPLGGSPSDALPAPAIERIKGIKDFAVENAKSARAFLGAIGMPVRELNIKVMGEESDPLLPLHQQRDLGLLSEAGCPAIADPGALLIEAAHREGFKVVPLIGPSSIVLALMASGLEGQRFAFAATCLARRRSVRGAFANSRAARSEKARPKFSSRRRIATMRYWARCWRRVSHRPSSASPPI